MKYRTEERIGVFSVAKIFAENFKWIFREQPVNDFGIDGFVEITQPVNFNWNIRSPIGKLIGVQIKSGDSFFRENTSEHFVFRGKKRHLDYWLNHTLPVILILYDKRTNSAYWKEVNHSTAILTGKNFKINIPRKNLLSGNSKNLLTSISHFKSSFEYKIWHLKTSSEEIRLSTQRKQFLYIEIEGILDSNDYNISVVISEKNEENYPAMMDEDCYRCSFFMSSGTSLTQGLTDILPWVNLYAEGKEFSDSFFMEKLAQELMVLDIDGFNLDIEKFRKNGDYFAMACSLCGNYCFRLELKPNILAFNFLALLEFLDEEPIAKERIFI